MNTSNQFDLLHMIEHPAFCVREEIIIHANAAAKHMLFHEGSPIMPFLSNNADAYRDFSGGCLYLNVTSAQITCGASVTRMSDYDLFIIDSEGAQLEALALAAVHLKVPLCNVVNLVEDVLAGDQQHTTDRQMLLKNLYQLSRIICNMADASALRRDSIAKKEITDFSAYFAELMEKMEMMVTNAGYQLEFENLAEAVKGLADRSLIERAVSNILTNAIKFSPKNSLIRATLSKKDDYLYFSVADPGGSKNERCNIFTRYMRKPGIEEMNQGLGLGMAIIHSVASDHGGTVLVDTPERGGTRVTMSFSLRIPRYQILRSPVSTPQVDYLSGLNPALVEFSEVLPLDAFREQK